VIREGAGPGRVVPHDGRREREGDAAPGERRESTSDAREEAKRGARDARNANERAGDDLRSVKERGEGTSETRESDAKCEEVSSNRTSRACPCRPRASLRRRELVGS
jgi:hypothetical protein